MFIALAVFAVYSTVLVPFATGTLGTRQYRSRILLRARDTQSSKCTLAIEAGQSEERVEVVVPAGSPVMVHLPVKRASQGMVEIRCTDPVDAAVEITSPVAEGEVMTRWFDAISPEGVVTAGHAHTVPADRDLLIAETSGASVSVRTDLYDGGNQLVATDSRNLPGDGQHTVPLSGKGADPQLVARVTVTGGAGSVIVLPRRESPPSDASMASLVVLTSPQSSPGNEVLDSLVISSFKGASFQDPLLGLVYMRDRWYDPKTGTFVAPDRNGNTDSANLYAFGGGDPVNHSDPTGRYEVDVHHWLTVFLARAAGFDEATARLIGFETQELDEDERDAMYHIVTPENMVKYQMASPRRLAELRQAAMDEIDFMRSHLSVSEWRSTGEYIHSLEDSFAHQSNPIARSFDDTYNQWIGHGLHGHSPDWTWERAPVAMDMAKATFDELKKFCGARHEEGCTAVSWEQIRSVVERFVIFRPPMTGDVKLGGVLAVSDATWQGYRDKVHILNSFNHLPGESDLLFASPLKLSGKEQAERAMAEDDFHRWQYPWWAPTVTYSTK